MAIILKPDEVTKISYGVEIEDDGTTAVLYLKAPEHKGDIVSVLVEDKETLKVFKEKEEI